MARQLSFTMGKKHFTVSPSKIDRRKLYGWTELMAVDDNGDPCGLLTADESGKYLIPLGGTGIGILSEAGQWVDRAELKTIDETGKEAPIYTSSFDSKNVLKEKVTPQEFLDYSITDFYELTDAPPEMLKAVGDHIYRFEYTYNDSYDPSPAFIMTAGKILYLLVGVRNVYDWLCFGDCETIDSEHDDRIVMEGDEDLDFSMF